MMISETMNAKLNEQIAAEFSAAHAYLAMACAFDTMGLKVLAHRFHEQYDEEREHALKIVKYVQEVGGAVKIGAVADPTGDYRDAEAIVQAALESEKNVTRMIHDLVTLSEAEKDYPTRSFLNWFVDEQVEEVSSMIDLLDLVQLAEGNMLQVESRIRHQMMAKA